VLLFFTSVCCTLSVSVVAAIGRLTFLQTTAPDIPVTATTMIRLRIFFF